MPLSHIPSVDIAQEFLKHWVYNYEPPKTLLPNVEKKFTSKFSQCAYQLFETINVFTATYHPQTDGEVKRYSRTLVAMLNCYVNDQQQDRDAYASTLSHANNSQVQRSIKTRAFDLVLNRRITNFQFETPVSTGNILTAAKQQAGLLGTLIVLCSRFITAHSRALQNGSRPASWKAREIIWTGGYVFIDVSDGVSKHQI